MVTLEAMSAGRQAVTAVSGGLTLSYLTRLTAVYVSILYSGKFTISDKTSGECCKNKLDNSEI